MADRTDFIRAMTQRIEEERARLVRLDLYYSGTQPLAFLAPEVREAVAGRLTSLVINWPRLVVGAVEERLDVEGFRLAPESAPDSDLWRIWQANGLDEGSQEAHTEALVHGRAFAIVWAGTNGIPRITVESARQMIVTRAPGSRVVIRALKRWIEDGYAFATLYEPDAITRWRSVSKAPDAGDASYAPAGGWSLRETIENPLGVVPVVPLVNRPRLLLPDGESELTDVLPIADAVNKIATDLMVSAEFSAMPRRWATGIEIAEEQKLDDDGSPLTDEDGQPIMVPANQFSPVAGRLWLAESAETRFGQFSESELTSFTNAIRMFTQALAAMSGLPPHYVALAAQDNPASADAIRSAEASLVSKARRKQRSFGGSWEDVMRLALLVRDGTPPAGADALETVWRDPETRTVAQAADAAVKLVQAGILPAQAALESLGYSPQAVERIRSMRRQDALDQVVAELELPSP